MQSQHTLSIVPAAPSGAASRPSPRKLHSRTCDACTMTFETIDKTGRFCSQECYRRWRRRDRIDTATCPICATEFKPKDKAHTYCTTACYRVYWNASVRVKATAGRMKQIVGAEREENGAFAKTPVPEVPESDLVFIPAQGTTPAVYKRAVQHSREELAARADLWTATLREGAIITLAGYGVALTVDQDRLVLCDEKKERRTLHRGLHETSCIVLLGSAGTVTLSAMQWCREQGIALLTIDRHGTLCGVVEPVGKYSTLRRAQYLIDPLPLAQRIVAKKLRACIEAKPSIELFLRQFIKELPTTRRLDELHMVEARAALVYWNAWRFDLRFKGGAIPDSWHSFTQRESVLSSGSNGRHATHPVNAALNYGYAVLAGRLQRSIVARGLDPMAGFLHADRDGRASLVYDLIEPLRAMVDARLLPWVATRTFTRSDFTVDTAGICTLRPDLARVVVQESAVPEQAIDGVLCWYLEQLKTQR